MVDENKPDYERGDFLIRGLLGVDEDDQSIAVGEQVRVGQTVRLQVRDAASADEDLKAALAAQRSELARPAGRRVAVHLQRPRLAHVRFARP